MNTPKPVHTFPDGSQRPLQSNPLKAIKDHCRYGCCMGDMESWKECNITTCILHPFRMGTNPYRKKREMTPEQKAVLVERLHSK